MPTPTNSPGTAAQPGSTQGNVLNGDLPDGFVRMRRLLRSVPDLGVYDPAEDRIREQLHSMGVHPVGGSTPGQPHEMALVKL
ncbi:hypothetical protein ACFV4X_12750 [Streptomyces ardesiacus]|uniref:hypothetical protein n=1 Tax=Streptomyces ardesiacus TaxID=285564 RepID=UPI00365D8E0D